MNRKNLNPDFALHPTGVKAINRHDLHIMSEPMSDPTNGDVVTASTRVASSVFALCSRPDHLPEEIENEAVRKAVSGVLNRIYGEAAEIAQSCRTEIALAAISLPVTPDCREASERITRAAAKLMEIVRMAQP